MIIEHAEFTITPGRGDEFAEAFLEARKVIVQAEGCRWVELHRGAERPETFFLLVAWETLEAHTEGFRNSPLFPQWRAIVGPFFAADPKIDHLTQIAERYEA